jgi:2'-5' RNA ligase
MGPLKFRAFIAADIVPTESLEAVLRELRSTRADLKIVRSELLHVTLKFLGDTDEELVEELVEGIRSTTADIHPFKMRLSGMGAFPSMSNIRVVWVGIEDGGILGDIARRLDERLRALGFERDKKGFKPHLTLARSRSSRNIHSVQEVLRRNASTDCGEYPVNSILLKKSVLSPEGPAYSTVAEVPLR